MQILKEDVRQSILDAALEEFSKNGYSGATMASIAARCGIVKGNLYRYFQSKQELYLAIIADSSSEILKTLKYVTGRDILFEKQDGQEKAYTSDEIAGRFVEALLPLIIKYKRQILMVLNIDAPPAGGDIKNTIIDVMTSNAHMDKEKVPEDFGHLVSEMVVSGLSAIIRNSKTDEELRDGMYALFRYHARGALSYSSVRTE